MPTQTTMTSLPPTVHPSQEEWDGGRLWDRIRSGFQGALRHIWSEETAGDPQPAWLLPEPVSPQPDLPPAQPEIQAEPRAEIQAEVQTEIQAEFQTEAPLPTGAGSLGRRVFVLARASAFHQAVRLGVGIVSERPEGADERHGGIPGKRVWEE